MDSRRRTPTNKRLTSTEFIRRAREVHGDLYDYSKVEYTNMHTKVLIIDRTYGEFWQRPYSHLQGHGNKDRGVKKSVASDRRRVTVEEFIERSRAVHGDLYDYSKVDFTNTQTPVVIIDPKYGEFLQTPELHMQGSGNRERSYKEATRNPRLTIDEFITRAREVHGDLYDYSKVDLVNTVTPVVIIDPKYGEFLQTPNTHLSGSGNPTRAAAELSKMYSMGTKEFIRRAREVHGDYYDYSKVKYINQNTPVIVVDPNYGEIECLPYVHLSGSKHGAGTIRTTEDFIKAAKAVHGDTYDYSKVVYRNSNEKVLITDPKYGDFWQRPGNHVHGANGCPMRTAQLTKPHMRLSQRLTELGVKHTNNDREMLSGMEIDVYIPEMRVGVEIDGVYWHSVRNTPERDYHNYKQQLATERGIKLYQVFDAEVMHRFDQLIESLSIDVGITKSRSADVELLRVDPAPRDGEYMEFLNKHCVHGPIESEKMCLVYEGEEPVSALGVSIGEGGVPVVDRYCKVPGVSIPGYVDLMVDGLGLTGVLLVTETRLGEVTGSNRAVLVHESATTTYYTDKYRLVGREVNYVEGLIEEGRKMTDPINIINAASSKVWRV